MGLGLICDNDTEQEPDFPSWTEIVNLSQRLVYSSSLVIQTYSRMYNGMVPDTDTNLPPWYPDLAVLAKRLNGVGTLPLSADTATDPGEDTEVATVRTIEGTASVHDVPTDTQENNMFKTVVETSDKQYWAYGSRKNYHPIIRKHVDSTGEFVVGDVWVSLTEFNQDEDDDSVHFMQVARTATEDRSH